MHNEFTLVKSKRRGRKEEITIPTIPTIPNVPTVPTVPVESAEQETDPTQSSRLNRRLSGIIRNLEKEPFAKDLLSNIDLVLEKLNASAVHLILCYGLGKFSESFCSLHQLGILILLQRKLKSHTEIFDPVFNGAEVEFLKNLNLEVIKDNEEAKRVVDKEKVTLVFLPHCPNQLVNNFLWANWGSNLKSCIIISNSFSKIIENNTKKRLAYSAKYISKSIDFCEEIPIQDTYDVPNVINDTSIHYFDKVDLKSKHFQTLPTEPLYSKDKEFIPKKRNTASKCAEKT